MRQDAQLAEGVRPSPRDPARAPQGTGSPSLATDIRVATRMHAHMPHMSWLLTCRLSICAIPDGAGEKRCELLQLVPILRRDSRPRWSDVADHVGGQRRGIGRSSYAVQLGLCGPWPWWMG